MPVEDKDMTPGERLIKVETKLDMLIVAVDKLVTKAEHEELKRRVDRLESAPTKWIPNIIAGASLLLVLIQTILNKGG